MLGGNPAMDQHPIQGGVEILSVASCYGNRDKLRLDGPLGPSTEGTKGAINLFIELEKNNLNQIDWRNIRTSLQKHVAYGVSEEKTGRG